MTTFLFTSLLEEKENKLNKDFHEKEVSSFNCSPVNMCLMRIEETEKNERKRNRHQLNLRNR
jgi:hypothetical protein